MLSQGLPGYRREERGAAREAPATTMTWVYERVQKRQTKALAAELSVRDRPKGSWEAGGHYRTINLSPGSVLPRLAERSRARKCGLTLG